MNRTAFVLALLASSAAAAQTFVLNHQGRLLDAGDEPLTSGEVELTFRLFDRDSGQDSQQLWEGRCGVSVTEGFYSVQLGENCGPALQASLFTGGNRWLEVAVEEVTLSPRLRIGSVPVSANALALGGQSLTDLDARYRETPASIAWAALKGIPAGLADGDDGLTSVTTGPELSGDGTEGTPLQLAQVPWAKLTGVEIATSNELSGKGTELAPLAIARVDWSKLDGVPPALADGDDGLTTVSVGAGLTGNGTTSSPLALEAGAAALTEALTAGSEGVGVGVTTPKAKLDVGGGVRIGNDTGTCTADRAGTLRWTGASLEVCVGTSWLALADLRQGTQLNPGRTCNTLKAAGLEANGAYWIDPDGPGGDAPMIAWCDMETEGGGWTLAAYCSQAPGTQNLYDLQCGGGAYDGAVRQGCASLPSVGLARASTHMGMTRSGTNSMNGTMLDYSVAYKLKIPDPAKVNFVNHSTYGPFTGTADNQRGPCVQAEITALQGSAPSGARYWFRNSLGVSWNDSYPTGYGVNPNSSCSGTWSTGPFYVSVHSGSGHSSPGSYTNTCVTGGKREYQHQQWYDANAAGQTGSVAIWFK